MSFKTMKPHPWHMPKNTRPLPLDAQATLVLYAEEYSVHTGTCSEMMATAQYERRRDPFLSCYMFVAGGWTFGEYNYETHFLTWVDVVIAQMPAQVQLVAVLSQ